LSPTVKLSCNRKHILNGKLVNCITLNPQNEQQHNHLHYLWIRILASTDQGIGSHIGTLTVGSSYWCATVNRTSSFCTIINL
jgi:hypothetical protein